jgi:hypothetical protein
MKEDEQQSHLEPSEDILNKLNEFRLNLTSHLKKFGKGDLEFLEAPDPRLPNHICQFYRQF